MSKRRLPESLSEQGSIAQQLQAIQKNLTAIVSTHDALCWADQNKILGTATSAAFREWRERSLTQLSIAGVNSIAGSQLFPESQIMESDAPRIGRNDLFRLSGQIALEAFMIVPHAAINSIQQAIQR